MVAKNDYFETICKVSLAFGTTVDREELLKLIVQSAIDTMKAKAACLWLIDEERGEFVPASQKGLSEKYFHLHLRVGKIASIVMKEGYLHARDATTDPRLEEHEAKKAEGISSMLIVPVMVKNKVIGILSLYTATPRDFSKDEIKFLSALAEQGGMSIEHARLIEQIRKNTKLFHDLAANINSTLDVKEIMRIMSEEIATAFGMKAVSVRLLDEKRETLKLVASYGLSGKYLNKGPISAEKSITEALKGKPVVVMNAATDQGVQYRKEKEEEGIVSILCIPIKAKEEVIGVLRLYSGVPREFTEDEIMLVIALAHQGGLAIQNASLYLMLKEDMKDLKSDIWSHRSWF